MYKSSTRPSRRATAVATALLLAGLALSHVGVALAQSALPIQIEADNAELSQREGTSTYTGGVVLTRGGLTLTGNRLVVTRINDRGNIEAVLTGGPARLDKQPDQDGDDVITGNASRIEYTNRNSTVVLRGNAVVQRGGDEVRSNVIRHNLDSERTEADSGGSSGERVRITIQPSSTESP